MKRSRTARTYDDAAKVEASEKIKMHSHVSTHKGEREPVVNVHHTKALTQQRNLPVLTAHNIKTTSTIPARTIITIVWKGSNRQFTPPPFTLTMVMHRHAIHAIVCGSNPRDKIFLQTPASSSKRAFDLVSLASQTAQMARSGEPPIPSPPNRAMYIAKMKPTASIAAEAPNPRYLHELNLNASSSRALIRLRANSRPLMITACSVATLVGCNAVESGTLSSAGPWRSWSFDSSSPEVAIDAVPELLSFVSARIPQHEQ